MTSNADETTMSRRGLFRVGAAGAAAATGLAAGSGGVAAQYDGWLDDVDNYDGTHDYTGQDEVTVAVGAVDGLKFGPAAILIDPGTTVVWEWTGEGGAHNVVADDETFNSGDPVSEEEPPSSTPSTTRPTATRSTTSVSPRGGRHEGRCRDRIGRRRPRDARRRRGDGDDGGDGNATDGGNTTDGGNASDGGPSAPDLSANDIGALALALGFAGALLVPLFYAAHKMASEE